MLKQEELIKKVKTYDPFLNPKALSKAYDFALKEAFKRDFPEYLIEGEMPSLSAFKAKFSASLTNKAAYAAAYNILKYKNIMSNPSSAGEAGLSFIMEKGSDISESGLGALENSMNAGIELMSRIIGKEFVKSKWLVEDNAVLEATRRIHCIKPINLYDAILF